MTIEVVYLDRDGTINIDPGYLSDPELFEFCPGALEGMARLRNLGLDLVVITNQSGVARGYFPIETVEAINARMRTLLAAEKITLAGIYVCPHGPKDGCTCRKPLPGLIAQAEAELGRRPGVMIGDSERDITAGKALGHRTVRIGDPQAPEAWTGQPDFVARTLNEAADWVAGQMEA